MVTLSHLRAITDPITPHALCLSVVPNRLHNKFKSCGFPSVRSRSKTSFRSFAFVMLRAHPSPNTRDKGLQPSQEETRSFAVVYSSGSAVSLFPTRNGTCKDARELCSTLRTLWNPTPCTKPMMAMTSAFHREDCSVHGLHLKEYPSSVFRRLTNLLKSPGIATASDGFCQQRRTQCTGANILHPTGTGAH